jgi:protein-S-isoprenylcysteine O-methyltransferase Ste14
MITAHQLAFAAGLFTLVAFGRAMKCFRFEGAKSPEKRLLVLSAYGCGVVQLAAIWLSAAPASVLSGAAVACDLAALGLFRWAITRHGAERPAFAFIAMAPKSLTTVGPYRAVRHPIYAAYLLGWLAGPLAAGQPLLLGTVLWMGMIYYRAAQKEEREYANSPLAREYRAYQERSGMFFPSIKVLCAWLTSGWPLGVRSLCAPWKGADLQWVQFPPGNFRSSR